MTTSIRIDLDSLSWRRERPGFILVRQIVATKDPMVDKENMHFVYMRTF